MLRLNLGRRLFLAAVCTVVQLLLVGSGPGMGLQAGPVVRRPRPHARHDRDGRHVSIRRIHFRYPGIWLSSIVSVWASSWIMAAAGTPRHRARSSPWYSPQYAIPLLGMILGNTLNGISLGLDRLGGELSAKRGQVETLLALGATRWEAARQPVQQAVRTGMIPLINSMMVVGIVSLPGMMTGQLLAGVSPLQAVKYQIVIMFLIASGTALGTVGVVLLSYRRLFGADHQFLYQRIKVHEEAIDLGRSPLAEMKAVSPSAKNHRETAPAPLLKSF